MLIKARFHFPEILFGLLLAVAIFAMGMTVQSSRQSPGTEQSSAPQKQTEKKSGADSQETQSLWIPTDSVGLYTLVLCVFTAILASVSIFQGIMLLRSDKTARIAANAAKLAAQAAIGVETARLLISDLEFQQPEVGNLAAHLQFPRVAISVKNYGRTPAFLGQQSSELIVAPSLPEIPIYPNAHDLESGRTIEGGASYDLPVARSRAMLSVETIEDIIAGRTFVWIYGYIFYRDFLHNPHWLRFCAQLFVSAGNGPVRVMEEGPEKYTESH